MGNHKYIGTVIIKDEQYMLQSDEGNFGRNYYTCTETYQVCKGGSPHVEVLWPGSWHFLQTLLIFGLVKFSRF